jgi:heme o synthase
MIRSTQTPGNLDVLMPRLRTAPLQRSAVLQTRGGRLNEIVGAYITLVKLRVVEQLLITTVPTMFVAARGVPNWWLVIATVIGGTLAAGGANAINMVIDRDIDALMDRTKHRPLVTGVITPTHALIFAIALEVAAFAWLWWQVNLLSAVLAVAACLFYVFVYTLWLKRSSVENIVIGGAAGAVPVLIGWSAVTNRLDWAPVAMFAVIFVWTPPHFWALAVKYKDDYGKAGVPMLPSVASFKTTGTRIVAYTVVLWVLSLVVWPVAHLSWVYGVVAGALGAMFLVGAVQLYQTGTAPNVESAAVTKSAMKLFVFSNVYISVLFIAMGVDQLIR